MKLYSLGRAIALAVLSISASTASLAYSVVDSVFVYPVLSVLSWLITGYQPDAATSLAADAVVRESRSTGPDLLARAKAFIDRAMRHTRYSAGGFALDTRLSPA